MSREYVQENEASRRQLRELASRLGDADFDRVVSGWKISDWFCHLAFWDRAILSLLTKLQESPEYALKMDMTVIDCVNDSCQLLSSAIPGRVAARLAIEAAELVDLHVAGLNDEVVAKLESSGMTRLLQRSLHRLHHLEKMSSAAAQTA